MKSKDTAVESQQNKAEVSWWASSSCNYADQSTANRPDCTLTPSEMKSVRDHFWLRSGHEDSCTKNSVAMFRCTSPTTLDPPLNTASHVPVSVTLCRRTWQHLSRFQPSVKNAWQVIWEKLTWRAI